MKDEENQGMTLRSFEMEIIQDLRSWQLNMIKINNLKKKILC